MLLSRYSFEFIVGITYVRLHACNRHRYIVNEIRIRPIINLISHSSVAYDVGRAFGSAKIVVGILNCNDIVSVGILLPSAHQTVERIVFVNMRCTIFGKRIQTTVVIVLNDIFGCAVELYFYESFKRIVNILLVIAVAVGKLF